MFVHDGIRLSKFERRDLDLLLGMKESAWFCMHRPLLRTLPEQQAWYEQLDMHPHTPRELLLCGAAGDYTVGMFFLDIDWVNRAADISWGVFDEYRLKGFGKRIVVAGTLFSFEVLNLYRLSAEILEHNKASIACAESAGYKFEGRKREAICKQGKRIDSLIYGKLATDP